MKMSEQKSEGKCLDRRVFLGNTWKLALSGTAIAVMSGIKMASAENFVHASEQAKNDILILNTAIAAEHEVVTAYPLVAESGWLSRGVLKVAVQFQGHHKAHIVALAGAVHNFGGESSALEVDVNNNIRIITIDFFYSHAS